MTRDTEGLSVEERAELQLKRALVERDARDPRDFYRVQLKELRAENRDGYEAAVRYYRETLLPRVADPEEDPLAAWTDYGRELATLRAPGRTVAVDPTGRAEAYESPAPRDALVLHLPDDRKRPALVVGLPAELTPPQRATYDWLVSGRRALREAVS
ncbi:MAG: hypothetical protein P8188_01710 [Gemmatimonadota bacterium]